MSNAILQRKHYKEPSVFTAENLLREARRQKRLMPTKVPPICILDPDGDIGQLLLDSGRAVISRHWACYHTELLTFEAAGLQFGLIRFAVGSSFAVLVAEELFASGCQLLISVTSAGQISTELGPPPYFVLIEKAWRDEGTSYHYLPPSEHSAIQPDMFCVLSNAFAGAAIRVQPGTVWTTDAPFRETVFAIHFYKEQGVAAVEMEAAALYAFAEARIKPVVCFAHVTNQMAIVDGDFEKGRNNGSHDALEVIQLAAKAWLASKNQPE
jgi:uridine phosphorylase